MKKVNVVLAALALSSGLANANLIKEGDEIRYLVEPKVSVASKAKGADLDVLLEEKLNELIEAQLLEISRDLESKIEIKLAELIK